MSLIAERNLYLLSQASEQFKKGNYYIGQGFFSAVCHEPRDAEHGVYHSLWTIKGKPSNIFDYGRNSFHDANGLSSTALEKAAAIDQYLKSKGITFPILKIEDQFRNSAAVNHMGDYHWVANVRGSGYGDHGIHVEHRPEANFYKMKKKCDKACLQADDPASKMLLCGIFTGLFGAVGGAILLIVKFQAR